MPYKQLGLICSSLYIPDLIQNVRALGFEVRALWCPNQDSAIQCASEFEIPFVASRPDEVLLRKEVEMVVIAGKPSLHAQMCVKALGIGKHILCESPAALSLAESQKMVQSSQYYPQILSLVGFGLRHMQIFQKAKEYLVNKDYLGTPLLCEVRVHCAPLFGEDFDWLWEDEMGGGVLNLVGSHVLDLISYLLEKRAERVQGLVRTHHDRHRSPTNGFRKLNADDFASFLLKFSDNFSASVTLNSLCPGVFEQDVVIFGTSGKLTAKNGKLFGTKFGEKEELLYEKRESPAENNREESHYVIPEHHVLPAMYKEALRSTLEVLSKALPYYNDTMEQSAESWKAVLPALGTVAGFEDAQYVRAVIDAVRHSSAKGDWVRVEL